MRKFISALCLLTLIIIALGLNKTHMGKIYGIMAAEASEGQKCIEKGHWQQAIANTDKIKNLIDEKRFYFIALCKKGDYEEFLKALEATRNAAIRKDGSKANENVIKLIQCIDKVCADRNVGIENLF